MRFITAGESHGPAITAILEGVPAGLAVSAEYINRQLARRRRGYGRGGRMKIEEDRVDILSGVRGGITLGSPLTLQVKNKDWENWQNVMDPGAGADLESRRVTRPRPGHADLAGGVKYNQKDLRNILERSSARETAMRVAAGAVARAFLEELGVNIAAAVVRVGSVCTGWPGWSLADIVQAVESSELMCPDVHAEKRMKEEIDAAKEAGDSLGGVFEIHAVGVPCGLGSHVQWDKKLDGRLSGALMSIQAIKGVEIGLGFEGSFLPGSKVHDEIYHSPGTGFYRQTNRAGGVEGGISNGEPIVVRAAMKPIPTLYKPLHSVDVETKEDFEASIERSDICAVPAACVVGEAVTAFEISRAVLEKFGGDHMDEVKARVERWRNYTLNF